MWASVCLLSGLCAQCSCDSAVKRVSWDVGRTKPDTGTMLIFPQQSPPVHRNTWGSGLSWTGAVHTCTQWYSGGKKKILWGAAASSSGGESHVLKPIGLCLIRKRIKLSLPRRIWDKIIALNGIRELWWWEDDERQGTSGKHKSARGKYSDPLICKRKPDGTVKDKGKAIFDPYQL